MRIIELSNALAATERELRELRELVSAAMEVIEPPPDSNCSCHINPPCNDCVEWSGLREWFEAARALLAKKGS
jgi:hypothetical protein